MALDPGYISAFSALSGAAIGGLASFGTSWVTQRSQHRNAYRDALRGKLEQLYDDFMEETSRQLAAALSHHNDDVTSMVRLYALVGRLRLMSSPPVVAAAERVIERLVDIYRGPNRTLHELHDFLNQGQMDLLLEFSQACRVDIDARF